MKCAYMNRECNRECVAYVGNAKNFSFPCVRLDSLYEISWTSLKIREKIDEY